MMGFQYLALTVAVVAAACDLRSRKIPNILTFSSALAAVCLHGYMGGLREAGLALGGLVVGVALFFPFFALGGLGAGDVKLLGAVGAFVGPLATVWVALYATISGGVMAILVASYAGYLRKAFVNLWCIVMYWRIEGPRPVPEMTLATHKGPRLAYAVPVLAGVMLTLWLR